ncbi:hypothetical protein [Guptibacillus hwajinpoensis]|uniref:hypothetical protein n=1 Tax=Guptibacillus hwajinpoensis TaxID=208199 RepID=UPI003D03395D
MKEDKPLINIYKRSLANELIRMGHDISHSETNPDHPKYQIYMLYDTPELRKDMAMLSGKEYDPEM